MRMAFFLDVIVARPTVKWRGAGNDNHHAHTFSPTAGREAAPAVVRRDRVADAVGPPARGRLLLFLKCEDGRRFQSASEARSLRVHAGREFLHRTKSIRADELRIRSERFLARCREKRPRGRSG